MPVAFSLLAAGGRETVSQPERAERAEPGDRMQPAATAFAGAPRHNENEGP